MDFAGTVKFAGRINLDKIQHTSKSKHFKNINNTVRQAAFLDENKKRIENHKLELRYFFVLFL